MITLEMLFLLRNVRPLLPPQAGRETRAGHCHLAQNATSMKTLLKYAANTCHLKQLENILKQRTTKRSNGQSTDP